MHFNYIVCVGIASMATLSDVKLGKINNHLVFTAFAFGQLWGLYKNGYIGLLDSVSGGLLPLLLFPFFLMRMLGAGDIKLLMALGAWLGFENCSRLMVLSILWGGVMAMVVMTVHKNFAMRFKKLWVYMKACILGCRLLPYRDFSRMERGSALPFALAVLLGLVNLYYEVF